MTVSDVVVVLTFGLVVLGLSCLLHDAWRHDRAARRAPTKREVSQARLARLHVVDRASYVVDSRFPGRTLDHAQARRPVDGAPSVGCVCNASTGPSTNGVNSSTNYPPLKGLSDD